MCNSSYQWCPTLQINYKGLLIVLKKKHLKSIFQDASNMVLVYWSKKVISREKVEEGNPKHKFNEEIS
jgi:hypothetical protein